jgi:hypothetical protein
MKTHLCEDGAMREYEFTLRFDVSSHAEEPAELIDKLGEHGCDDATIGVGIPGRLAMMFSREADSAEDAVLSAVRDVRSALPDAVLVEAAPDLVGITEVAELVGKSRQNIRKLLIGCKCATPAPAHEGSVPLWHLAPVLVWLRNEKRYRIEDELLELAGTTMRLNVAANEAVVGRFAGHELGSVSV